MFRKIFISGLAAVLMLSATGLAADVEVRQSQVDASVNVSGELNKENSRRMLMLYCLKDDSAFEKIPEETDSQQSTDAFSAIGYTVSDINGAYEFPKFVLNGTPGEYSFYVTVFGADNVYSKNKVKLVTKEYIDGFLNDVSQKSGSEIYFEIGEEISTDLLDLNIPLYNMLTDSGKKKAADGVENTSFKNIPDFSDRINKESAKIGVDYAKDGEALDLFLFPEKNDTEFAAVIKELSGAEAYKNISCIKSLAKKESGKRIQILDNALKSSFANRDELLANIYISVINYEMKNCSGHGDISSIIELYKDDVLKELDYSLYKKSSYRSDLNKELLKKQFDSVDDLIEYIEDYLKSASEGHSGPGGGGGGGSSRGTTSSPKIVSGKDNSSNSSSNKYEKFSDMNGFEWAEASVLYLFDKGIISGKGNGIFAPQANVTREEFVKMIVLAFSLFNEGADCSFNDVSAAAWYKPYVASAVDNGIVNGISGSLFGTGECITRQDMAVCVYRAMGNKSESIGEQIFTDSDEIAPYAAEAVNAMKIKGIINGYSDGSFAPNKFCTRAEAAKIIYGAINQIGR